MTRLRLLMVTSRYWPLVGDTEQITARLADGFSERECDVTVLTAKWHADWPATVMHRLINVVRVSHSPRGGWNTLRYMRALSRWLRQHGGDFDLAYVMNLKHDAYAVVGAARAVGLPVVLRARRAGPTSDCAWQATARFGNRIRRRCQAAQAFVASTPVGADQLQVAGYSAAERINDGCEEAPLRSAAERFNARAALADINHDLAVAEYAPVAVCVERLTKGRGLPELVHSWVPVAQRWPGAKLWLIGDGPLRDTLYEQIVDLGLHHQVYMPGSFDDLHEVYQAADVFISPSPNFGATQALLDAMASGLPILAADTPDMRGIIEDGVQGRLLVSGDTDALATVVQQMAESPGVGSQMGLAARRRASEAFPISRTIEAHEQLFQRVVNASPQSLA